MEAALSALIENAIQAMGSGGKLHIGAQMLYDESPAERCAVHGGGDYAVISVGDTGCGMDRATQARIFEPFYTKRRQRSNTSGLGLSAACGIVKAHGGYIQVRSIPGEGSTFKIYLPVRNNHRHISLLHQDFRPCKCAQYAA